MKMHHLELVRDGAVGSEVARGRSLPSSAHGVINVMCGFIVIVAFTAVALSARAQVQLEAPALVPETLTSAAATPLQAQREDLVRSLDLLSNQLQAHNRDCGRVRTDDSPRMQSCRSSSAATNQSIQSYQEALARYHASLNAATATPNYVYSGNGMIGGTTWRVGYYSPVGASEEVRARAMHLLRQQAELAGIPYNEAVDFGRYNFVLGIANSTEAWRDLATRVIFDELSNGEFSTRRSVPFLEAQGAYNALRGRRFDELACHSNGAMICLAALTKRDVVARDVVLYGPQVTPESLVLWNRLVENGQINSLHVYLNENDPVPAASLALGAAWNAHQAVAGRPILFDAAALRGALHGISPNAQVSTFACDSSVLSMECHSMSTYTVNRGCLRASELSAPVPGTTVNGRAALAPPSPRCNR